MLEQNFLEFLFTKGILVSGEASENAFAVCFTLANKFGISITEGKEHAHEDMIRFAASMLGEYVPPPFYRDFPDSVRELSSDQLLFDRLFHYMLTYGFGDFSEAGHSLFEKTFEKLAFKENAEVKKFVILTEEQALERIAEYAEDMLGSTRPLNDIQYGIVNAYANKLGYEIQNCACKDTAIKLLIDSRDVKYARFISLSDIIKLVDNLNYRIYKNENIKKLNLKNRDRKFISMAIDTVFENGCRNVRECFEKKALWCGLLHHIHYEPKTPEAQKFVALMRGKENLSVYSEFERAMASRDIEAAVTCLREGKGQGALLRHLNYIMSRCKDAEDVAFVMDSVKSNNAVILIQLIMQYASYAADKARSFRFSRSESIRRRQTSRQREKARFPARRWTCFSIPCVKISVQYLRASSDVCIYPPRCTA